MRLENFGCSLSATKFLNHHTQIRLGPAYVSPILGLSSQLTS